MAKKKYRYRPRVQELPKEAPAAPQPPEEVEADPEDDKPTLVEIELAEREEAKKEDDKPAAAGEPPAEEAVLDPDSPPGTLYAYRCESCGKAALYGVEPQEAVAPQCVQNMVCKHCGKPLPMVGFGGLKRALWYRIRQE